MADDVQVANRRFDASENEALIGMARMGADAFGYTAELRIDRGLAQLLRLRLRMAQPDNSRARGTARALNDWCGFAAQQRDLT